MRLELADFPVNDIAFDRHMRYESGILQVDKAALISMLRQDSRITGAEVEIVRPGDLTRVVGVRDVVEPRAKVKGGPDFPGALGPLHTAGEGQTNRLSGMAVVTSARYTTDIRTGTGAPSASILDMWGRGAEITPFSSTHNLVLLLDLQPGLAEYDVHVVIQTAELRVAQALAKTTFGLKPERTEIFELGSTPDSLPRVVYLLGFRTTAWNPHPGITLYGLPIKESLATLIHPNEILDGAVITDTRKGAATAPRTWEWQNQPVITGLYRAHGKRLNFLGVIFQRIHFQTYMGKEAGALAAAKFARMMGAQAAIITRENVSGNMLIDSVLTVQACEKAGIKTVFVTPEYGGKGGDELPLLFTVSEMDAIASTGSFERRLTLPAPEKVIGPGGIDTLLDLDLAPGRPVGTAREGLSPDGWDAVAGGVDWWGGSRMTCEEY